MVYGSWSGGLFALEIDKPIYPGKNGIDEINNINFNMF